MKYFNFTNAITAVHLIYLGSKVLFFLYAVWTGEIQRSSRSRNTGRTRSRKFLVRTSRPYNKIHQSRVAFFRYKRILLLVNHTRLKTASLLSWKRVTLVRFRWTYLIYLSWEFRLSFIWSIKIFWFCITVNFNYNAF